MAWRSYARDTTPKVPLTVVQMLKMKSEEKADTRRGTPGYWQTNGSDSPFYVPGWMVLSEEALLKMQDKPYAVQQVGPYWRES